MWIIKKVGAKLEYPVSITPASLAFPSPHEPERTICLSFFVFRYRTTVASSPAATTMMSVRAINGCFIIRTATTGCAPPVSLFRHRIQRLRSSHLREFSKSGLGFPPLRQNTGGGDAPSCSACIHSLVESVSQELESVSRRKRSRISVRASVKYVSLSFLLCIISKTWTRNLELNED